MNKYCIGATHADRTEEHVTHVEAPLSRSPCSVDSKLKIPPPHHSKGVWNKATVEFTSIPSENVTLYWTRSVSSQTANDSSAHKINHLPKRLVGIRVGAKVVEKVNGFQSPADIINFIAQVTHVQPYFSFRKYGSEHDGYFTCYAAFMGRDLEVAARNKKECTRRASHALCNALQLSGTHGSWTCTDDHDFDRNSQATIDQLNGNGACIVCLQQMVCGDRRLGPMWYVRQGPNPCQHYMCRHCACNHACVEWCRDANPQPLGSSTCPACRALYHVPVRFVTNHATPQLVPPVLTRVARETRIRARRDGDPPGPDIVVNNDPPEDPDPEPSDAGDEPDEEADPLEIADGELYTKWNYLYLLPMMTSYCWMCCQAALFILYLSSVRKSALALVLILSWSAPLYYAWRVSGPLNSINPAGYIPTVFTSTIKTVIFFLGAYTILFVLLLYIVSEPLIPFVKMISPYYAHIALGAELIGVTYNLIGHLVLVCSRTAGIHQYSGRLMYGRPFWFGRPIIGIEGYRGVTSCQYYRRLCDSVYYEIRSGNKVHIDLNRFIRADMARRVGNHTLVDPTIFSNSVLMLSQRIQTESIIDPMIGEGGIGNVRY